MNNNFNFENALTVSEWFKSKNVKGSNRTFFIKECESSDGNKFTALALHNGERLEDGRDAFAFFVLSKKLSESYALTKQFLREFASEMRIIDSEDLDTKFGIIYLPKKAEVWDFD